MNLNFTNFEVRQWLFVRSRTNISVLFVRSRMNISVLFIRSRTNSFVIFIRSRTNSFVLFVWHSVQIPSCLYTGQAAQLIATQGQSRSGDCEVPGSVHTDPWLMHAWLLFRSMGKKLYSHYSTLCTQAVQLGFSL